MVIQEEMSWVPFQIYIMFEEKGLGQGTAFTYLHNGETYLITNWHNVSGRRPDSLKLMNDYAAIPDSLVLCCPEKVNKEENIPEGQSEARWMSRTLDLYNEEKPIWYEHPEHGHNVDAVAIPLKLDNTWLKPANSTELNLENIILRPSLDVYVLGYPQGMTGGAKFPIWKRGSIASEPDIDLDNLPKYFIDTATRRVCPAHPFMRSKPDFFLLRIPLTSRIK